MKNILSEANRAPLREFALSNVLLAFDYDGTLAPIVSDPDAAAMRRRTRELLSDLTTLYPVVVISGRVQPDALRRLDGVGVLGVVGNHGIEPWDDVPRHDPAIRSWLPRLEETIAPFKGVAVEDKVYSLTVHYRRSRQKTQARAAILKAVATLGDVRVIASKQAVNILPNGAPSKGIAIERERDRLQCDTAIYIGDDETDEDVFALDQPGRLLTVRVGAKRRSAARYCIPNQRAIDDFLRALIDCRRTSGAPLTRRATASAGKPVESSTRLDDVLELMRLVWGLDHALQRTSRWMEESLGVSGPQRLVIRIVGRFPGVPAGHLASLLHMHPSTLTGTLKQLEAEALLRRRADPQDRRRSLLSLTDKGRRFEIRTVGTVEATIQEVLDEADPDRIAAARGLLESITDKLGRLTSRSAAKEPATRGLVS